MLVRRMLTCRLLLTAEQEQALDAQAHACRAMWNLLHEWWTWGAPRRWPTIREGDNAIRQARKDIPWLAVVPARVAQAVLSNYTRAWRNHLEGRTRRPVYKKRGARLAVDNPQASQFRIVQLNRRMALFTVSAVGRVAFRTSEPLPGVRGAAGRITGARLIRDPLGWLVMFRTELALPDPSPHKGGAVGVDCGVGVPLALSTGTLLVHPAWMKPKEWERLRRLERKAARQRTASAAGEPRSARLQRTYDQIASLRARAKRRRHDWQNKRTTELANQFGLIAVENLDLRSLLRKPKPKISAGGRPMPNRRNAKRALNRLMGDEAHGRTVRLLEYKAAARGGAVVKVPPRYTSQTCSECDVRDKASRRKQDFKCSACGWTEHADVNAAINIKAAGLAVYGRGANVIGRGTEASTLGRLTPTKNLRTLARGKSSPPVDCNPLHGTQATTAKRS